MACGDKGVGSVVVVCWCGVSRAYCCLLSMVGLLLLAWVNIFCVACYISVWVVSFCLSILLGVFSVGVGGCLVWGAVFV
ncbi:MAG: hypothetical protein DRO11_03730 [Methanobacteriota archaeon]|nr:MAG: hypothetical protein DRO11_03730 [Euryarchaeota archaeon]